jgi:hypothetical protein
MPAPQISAPATFAARNSGYGMRPTPATIGVNVRTHGMKRATTTASAPYRA